VILVGTTYYFGHGYADTVRGEVMQLAVWHLELVSQLAHLVSSEQLAHEILPVLQLNPHVKYWVARVPPRRVFIPSVLRFVTVSLFKESVLDKFRLFIFISPFFKIFIVEILF